MKTMPNRQQELHHKVLLEKVSLWFLAGLGKFLNYFSWPILGNIRRFNIDEVCGIGG